MKPQHLLLILTAFATKVLALGINCRGSFQCVFLADNPLGAVTGFIQNIDPNRHYNNGDHIACQGFICAFLQSTTGGANGDTILQLANTLSGKCHQCGSIPTGFLAGDNNVEDGQLTFNAAQEGICITTSSNGDTQVDNGLCDP